MGALAWLRVLGSDAAGGHGGRGSRPPWAVGEGRNVPRVGGLGWARDAADLRTQAVPGDQKKKVCLSVSLVLPFGRFEVQISRAAPTRARAIWRPQTLHLFLLFPLLFGERLGTGGQRRELLCPERRWSARSADCGGPGSTQRRPRRGGGPSSPDASPLRNIFPARPRFGEAFPCAPTVRARRAHCEHRGALWNLHSCLSILVPAFSSFS